jgi:hypothetical protein
MLQKVAPKFLMTEGDRVGGGVQRATKTVFIEARRVFVTFVQSLLSQTPSGDGIFQI